MKVQDLDLEDWQTLVNKYKVSSQNKDASHPIAMRCENTQLSIARFSGGATYNGCGYTFFAPPVPGEKNEDGSQFYAWLLVRDDFLRWAVKEAKKMETKKKTSTDSTQGELGLC